MVARQRQPERAGRTVKNSPIVPHAVPGGKGQTPTPPSTFPTTARATSPAHASKSSAKRPSFTGTPPFNPRICFANPWHKAITLASTVPFDATSVIKPSMVSCVISLITSTFTDRECRAPTPQTSA